MNIYTISFLLILIFNYVKNKKSMHALQLSLYNENNRYIKWIFNNLKELFLTIEILSLITVFLAYFINGTLSKILIVIALVFYFLEVVYITNNYMVDNFKKPFITTKSVRRLMVTILLLFISPIIIYILDNDNGNLMILVEAILSYFSYFVVLIAKSINYPLELIISKYHKTKAEVKLKSMPNLETIAIAGAYGKTSTKIILSDILNSKYMISKTPRDLNTEYGLTLTVNNYLTKNDQLLITDIGAYKIGEVSKLCKMIKPKYGIITNIGIKNFDNFNTSEDIQKARFELIESLPSDGIAILNKDDKKQTSYKIKNNCKKIWIGIENKDADVIATNIIYSEKGTKFKVEFKNEQQKYVFETKLLGIYNIYNILSSIALGKELEIPITKLIQSVKKIRQIEGRLEIKKFDYMYQINNLYNTNPIGAKVGLDILGQMPGKKYVVTDGINPTTSDENERVINNIYGSQISKLNPDLVILVGGIKNKYIFKGLIEGKYNKDNIYVVKNLDDAYNLIKKQNEKERIYALFE